MASRGQSSSSARKSERAYGIGRDDSGEFLGKSKMALASGVSFGFYSRPSAKKQPPGNYHACPLSPFHIPCIRVHHPLHRP